jgi:hypothetical protein
MTKAKDKFHVSLGGKPYPIDTPAQIGRLSKAWCAAGASEGDRLRIYHSNGARSGLLRMGTEEECYITY